jgi:hypothetical protein
MNFDEFIRLVDEWLEQTLLPTDALAIAQSRLKQADSIVKKAELQKKAHEAEVLQELSEIRKRVRQIELAERAKRDDLKGAATDYRNAAYLRGKAAWEKMLKTKATLSSAVAAREKLATEVQVLLNQTTAKPRTEAPQSGGASKKAASPGGSSAKKPLSPDELDRQMRELEIEEELRGMVN